LKFRRAEQSDKNSVLRFCTNTFEWGDYIEEVWDVWYADPNGYLMIAEENEVISAVSHAYLCPNRNRVWLEGVRVNPNFRRRSIGTELIKKMVQYGKEQGAQEAAGLVSVKNVASQGMMDKNDSPEVKGVVNFADRFWYILELKIKKLKIAMQKSDNHLDADMTMIRIQALE
jgi:N-acetylglutamate synthase-like GNAT family acetyltransferase